MKGKGAKGRMLAGARNASKGALFGGLGGSYLGSSVGSIKGTVQGYRRGAANSKRMAAEKSKK